ncbi:MAG: ATP-grasp domain-containing protein [Clostridiales bacterium]|jgi:gamma-F420-2:alpha-L-glutamate ligase|nr:ATP-grasp domain-containing protein [Clostridiales bacterium]
MADIDKIKGWLVYDNEGAKRNEWFINHILALSKKHNLNIQFKIMESAHSIPNNIDFPDFAIVRTINPSLTAALEARGIRCFNNAKTSFIANDKYKTYLFCKSLGIDVMPTERVINDTPPTFTPPYVLKSVAGHGGSEVFLVKNNIDFPSVIKNLEDKSVIAQPLCSIPGMDMRVYVLAGEVALSVLRRSEKDFRSNFSLGGTASIVECTPYQKDIINKLYNSLSFDFVGIDFIFNDGEWILNEIEDVVGTRMIYNYTSIDIVDKWLTHISHIMNYK